MINFLKYLCINLFSCVLIILILRVFLGNEVFEIIRDIVDIIQNLLKYMQIKVESKYKRVIIGISVILIFFIHYINTNSKIDTLVNSISSILISLMNGEINTLLKSIDSFGKYISAIDFLTFFKPNIFILLVSEFFYFRKILAPKEQSKEIEIKIKLLSSLLFISVCFYLLNVENNHLKTILIIIKNFYIFFIYKLWKEKENDIIKENKKILIIIGIVVTLIYFILTLCDKKDILNSLVILFQDIITAYIGVHIETLLKIPLKNSVESNRKNDNDSNL